MMGYSINDFVEQLSHLEGLLAEDFQGLSEELRRMPADAGENNIQFRLVEQLQYHDIIRQKVAHVKQLLVDMAGNPLVNKPGENTSITDPDLVELALGLLRYTQMEYRGVVALTQQLIFASEETHPRIIKLSLFAQEIQDLIKKLETLYLETDDSDAGNSRKGKEESFRKIQESFSMKSERDVYSALFEDKNEPGSEPDDESNPEGEVELF